MLSIVLLSAFNVVVLLFPPAFITSVLELMDLPQRARYILLAASIINVGLSVAFERWGAPAVAQAVGYVMSMRKRHRVRDGKTYKAIEGGMR